jgi:acetyl-CoA carboxylase biotin carboxyl carrier protein
MDINDIEHIIKILKQNEVSEFELEQDGTRLKLTRGAMASYAASDLRGDLPPPAQQIPVAYGSATQNGAHQAAEDLGRYVKVESPIVGTFYRKPSPDAEAFVKEGDSISKGSTLCIIEAMKLMNEIEAPASGKIVKILSTEGQVVEFGEVLFLIDPAV